MCAKQRAGLGENLAQLRVGGNVQLGGNGLGLGKGGDSRIGVARLVTDVGDTSLVDAGSGAAPPLVGIQAQLLVDGRSRGGGRAGTTFQGLLPLIRFTSAWRASIWACWIFSCSSCAWKAPTSMLV